MHFSKGKYERTKLPRIKLPLINCIPTALAIVVVTVAQLFRKGPRNMSLWGSLAHIYRLFWHFCVNGCLGDFLSHYTRWDNRIKININLTLKNSKLLFFPNPISRILKCKCNSNTSINIYNFHKLILNLFITFTAQQFLLYFAQFSDEKRVF